MWCWLMVAIIDDTDDGVQFKYLPLYLEWAPMAVFHADKDQEERAEGPATGEAADGTEVTDASTRTEGTGKTAKVCMLVVDCAFWLTASIPPSPLPPPNHHHPLQTKSSYMQSLKEYLFCRPPPPPHPPIKLHERFKRARVHWRKTILNSKRKMVVKREQGFWTVKGKWQSKERCVSSVLADWLIASVAHSLIVICFVLSHWNKGS